jgi:hypothetical protein
MPKGYQKRTRGLFDPDSSEPYRLSRSKIDLFHECPRCAFLDLKLGIKRPQGPAFTLNNAVDELLKREFDNHRAAGKPHPLMKKYGLDAVPLAHENLEEWRDALRRGISYLHEATNLMVRGGIDDVWQTSSGELIIVDYKATSKKIAPSTEEDLYDSYKRQMEIYQWLFRRNGFKVLPRGYFLYVNGKSGAKSFDNRLEFDVVLIPHEGSDDWIEPLLFDLKGMLMSDEIPSIGKAFNGGPCDFCTYREAAGNEFKELAARTKRKSAPASSSRAMLGI